jgi:predicted transglutaminase-like cysteine proteinase
VEVARCDAEIHRARAHALMSWDIKVPPTCRRAIRACAMPVLLLASALAVWAAQPGFSTSISAALIDQYVSRFGQDARARLRDWQGFLRARVVEARAEPELQHLAQVNDYFNRVRFLPDLQHWGAEDYWATPAEFSASHGGDCEDYAIAKYFALKELGVPTTRLRITYVTSSRIREPHMVLAYYATPEAEPLILDNLDNQIRPASRRPDLVPVYSFNEEDALTAGGRRAVNQIRRWRDLTLRLQGEAST